MTSTAGSRPAAKYSSGTPTRSPVDVAAAGLLVVAHRRVERGRVARVAAGDHLEHARRAADVGGEGADLVEARREGDEAVAGDAAVGGLEADHAR